MTRPAESQRGSDSSAWSIVKYVCFFMTLGIPTFGSPSGGTHDLSIPVRLALLDAAVLMVIATLIVYRRSKTHLVSSIALIVLGMLYALTIVGG